MPELLDIFKRPKAEIPEKQTDIPKELHAIVKRFDAALGAYMLAYEKENPAEVDEERAYYEKGRIECLEAFKKEGIAEARRLFDKEIDELNMRRREIEEDMAS